MNIIIKFESLDWYWLGLREEEVAIDTSQFRIIQYIQHVYEI